MNKDLIKTIGGILIIAAIVVATFLYGNQQRQEQVRRDQALQEQQKQTDTNTEVVTEPEPQPAPSTPGGVGGGTMPTTTPAAGGEVGYVAVTAGLAWLWTRQRASRKALAAAALR